MNVNWWVGDLAEAGRYVELVSWVFWVLASITLHELAHGWAAIRQGDDTPIHLGRMTVNPVVHMGLQSLVIFGLCGIAWGSMPVNPHRFKDGRRGETYVSAAGPAMNALIAAACLLAVTAWVRLGPQATDLYRNVTLFLFTGMGLNLALAALNLLPIPPLDGATALAGVSRRFNELNRHPNAPMVGMMVFIAVFFMTPLGGVLFDCALWGADTLADAAGSAVGNQPIWSVMADPGTSAAAIDPGGGAAYP